MNVETSRDSAERNVDGHVDDRATSDHDHRRDGHDGHARSQQHRDLVERAVEAHVHDFSAVVAGVVGISVQRTCSMRRQVPAKAEGIRPLATPGPTPLLKMLESPCRAASSTRAMYLSGSTPHGYCSGPGDDPTTLTPAARMRMTSAAASGNRVSPIAQWTTHSGPVASTASRSDIAVTPVTTSSSSATPHSTPASLPTFSGDETHSPVDSNCGLVIDQFGRAGRPTFPVPMWTTRIAMSGLRPEVNVGKRFQGSGRRAGPLRRRGGHRGRSRALLSPSMYPNVYPWVLERPAPERLLRPAEYDAVVGAERGCRAGARPHSAGPELTAGGPHVSML